MYKIPCLSIPTCFSIFRSFHFETLSYFLLSKSLLPPHHTFFSLLFYLVFFPVHSRLITFPWCNGYRRRKWTRRHEFKSWTRLIAFHIALIPLGKKEQRQTPNFLSVFFFLVFVFVVLMCLFAGFIYDSASGVRSLFGSHPKMKTATFDYFHIGVTGF